MFWAGGAGAGDGARRRRFAGCAAPSGRHASAPLVRGAATRRAGGGSGRAPGTGFAISRPFAIARWRSARRWSRRLMRGCSTTGSGSTAAGRSFCKAARNTAAARASSPTALSAARRTDALSPSPAKPISLSSASSGNASLLSKKPLPRNASASGGADTPVASRAPKTFASCVRSSLIWIPNAAARSSSMPSSWRGGSIMPLSSVCPLRFGPRYQRCCGVFWRLMAWLATTATAPKAVYTADGRAGLRLLSHRHTSCCYQKRKTAVSATSCIQNAARPA